MALRYVFHQVGQADTKSWQRGVILRRQLSRRKASGVEELPELVPAPRVVMASRCRRGTNRGTAEDDVKVRSQDVGQDAHGFHTATNPVAVEPSVIHSAAYLLFSGLPSGSSLTQIAM